jgi:hypothetical protein
MSRTVQSSTAPRLRTICAPLITRRRALPLRSSVIVATPDSSVIRTYRFGGGFHVAGVTAGFARSITPGSPSANSSPAASTARYRDNLAVRRPTSVFEVLDCTISNGRWRSTEVATNRDLTGGLGLLPLIIPRSSAIAGGNSCSPPFLSQTPDRRSVLVAHFFLSAVSTIAVTGYRPPLSSLKNCSAVFLVRRRRQGGRASAIGPIADRLASTASRQRSLFSAQVDRHQGDLGAGRR